MIRPEDESELLRVPRHTADPCLGVFCSRPSHVVSTACGGSVCGTLDIHTTGPEDVVQVSGSQERLSHLGKSGVRGVVGLRKVGAGCYKVYRGDCYSKESAVVRGTGYHAASFPVIK